MTLPRAVLLAIVQGITEFLPVSSSGHLVVIKAMLGAESPGAMWEVALHLGTLIAVLLVFRRELKNITVGFCAGLADLGRHGTRRVWQDRPDFRMAGYILLGTVPAGVVGLVFGGRIERLFSQPMLSAVMILVTGGILSLTRPHSLVRPQGRVRLLDSLWIGAAQAAALLPGISRSGTTISMGLMRGIRRQDAARFSFLLAVPATLAAAVAQLPKIGRLPGSEMLAMVTGLCVAAVTGYLALRLLLRVVDRGKLHYFAYYCWAAGAGAILFFWASSSGRP